MRLVGSRIFLKPLENVDAEKSLQLEVRNRAFFQEFSIDREEAYYTLEGQLKRIQANQEYMNKDQSYTFGIFLHDREELIGSIGLYKVERGPAQSCIVGYVLDKAQNGKGYMTETLRLLVDYAFSELKLHRLEAGVKPDNLGSIRVLEKGGFRKEGIARKNIKINGKWEDHQILALLNEDR
ncbi:GNAT family N-acetyltransferase [Neobacillus jeddahensis]|uniref:GNAT family N-acetyltransferase n=1 Tax=Neobacillus jeddahensis TaxID=1461580 RepID=UPI00058C756E|nr:GNAT family protein [Neobacillus jeddahensis]